MRSEAGARPFVCVFGATLHLVAAAQSLTEPLPALALSLRFFGIPPLELHPVGITEAGARREIILCCFRVASHKFLADVFK
jgi:hypothetical protein